MTKITWDEFCELLADSVAIIVDRDVLLYTPIDEDDTIAINWSTVDFEYDIEIHKHDNEYITVLGRSTYELIGNDNQKIVIQLLDLK